MKRVLITGAEGLVGTVLRAGLAGDCAITPLTFSPQAFASITGDIRSRDDMARACRGMDVVIHLAGAIDLQASWDDVLQHNILGTRVVFEAAHAAGVGTVVFASSGHVLGGYEDEAGPALFALDDPRCFDETTPPRPNSPYAVSKLFGETLGRYYFETQGLRVICLRLGMVLAHDNPTSQATPGRGRSGNLPWTERYPRIRAKWLSHRDCCQLFARAIEAEATRWALVAGTSNNPRQIWSLASARHLLGYAPADAAPIAPPPHPEGQSEDVRLTP